MATTETVPPPTAPTALSGRRPSEGVARAVAMGAAGLLLAVLLVMIFRLTQLAWPIFRAQGLGWVVGTDWTPNAGHFGALPFIYGTAVTSLIALVIAAPVGLGTALFISEIVPGRLKRVLASVVDLLAAVPSVVYGLWGIFVLLPILNHVESGLASTVGKVIPIFAGPTSGTSFFSAGVVLAIMVIPTVSAVSREVLLTIPRDVREAAYALGATRWEVIRMSVLPPARAGIVGALILGLGRALGETIAVTMLVGNIPIISKSIFSSGYSMASVLANQFGEAAGQPLFIQALIGIGLVLFLFTVVIDMSARLLVRKTPS